MSYLTVGMTAPNMLTVTITNSPQTATLDNLDLSGFSYCRFMVRKPTGTADVEWEATSVTPTADSIEVTYEFAGGDLSEAGCYVLKPRLSTTPFYQLVYLEEGQPPTKQELNPIDVRYCANIDVEVFDS